MVTNGRGVAATVMALILWAAADLGGIFVKPEITSVPVGRLVTTLERQLADAPRDPTIHIKLARLYGMAYAVNADEVPVTVLKNRGEEVWFGHEPHLIPHTAKPAADARRADVSRKYLQKAIEHYRKALEFDPQSLLARLGHGWTQQEAGDRATAVAEYRRVIEQAWPKEQGKKFADMGDRFFTEEAGGYLIPLLDGQRDAAEIASLKDRISRLERLPRPITPIAIPLSDSATVSTIVDLDAQVFFDADGTGLRRRWTWISPDAGWLVYDASKSGRIVSALQWFGNVTFWLFWNNGYDALAALDDDANGELRGGELRHLAVWRDEDRDGVSDPGEVRPLAAYDISALSCRFTRGDGLLVAARSDRGVRLTTGGVRPTYDVILRPSLSVSPPEPH